MEINKAYIAKYYDNTLPYYRRFWYRGGESNALHYGFWDNETKSVEEALLNENRFLAEVAKIQSTDKVLDAGCGVGGSSIWLAKQKRVKVIGITLSEKQIKEAKKLAKRVGVDGEVEFQLKDFLKTGFEDNSFDVVWAIESVCHTENKIDFLLEAYRILRSGGRLIVADGILKRDPNPDEEKLYKDFLIGLALPNLEKFSNFENTMVDVGFKNIKALDKTADIKKSAKILYQRCLIVYPFFKLAHMLGFIPDVVMKNGPAGIAQYKMVKRGLAGYGVFYGEK